MSPQLQQTVTLLIPIVVGILTVPIMNGFKALSDYVCKLPPTAQRALVGLIAYLLNLVAGLLHITLPTSLGGFDSTAVGTLIAATLAYGLHAANQLVAIKAGQKTVVQAVAPDSIPNPIKQVK